MRVLPALLALILAAALAGPAAMSPAWAQGGNPFAPGSRPQAQPQPQPQTQPQTQTRTDQAAPATQPAKPSSAPASAQSSIWGAWFTDLQRQVNRQLNQRLAEINRGSPLALAIGAAFAFLYGVFHAAGPGHGKMLVVSYFIGRDGSAWRGAMMGTQIALVHVGGAIVIAVIATALMAGTAPPSAEDMRDVKLASYAAVAAIGAWLLMSALRGGGHAHHHGDGHGRGHGHGHDHAHRHHGGAHRHGGAVVSLAAGVVPCTGAVLVLIYCIANGTPLLGLVMVLLIGLGMAVTLTGFGFVGMFARRRTLAFAGEGRAGAAAERPQRWRRGLDLAGPALILLLGVALFIGAY